ncbi:hypothetical protein GF324_00455 [bacterium]|nr:hypothetical protein [bacterium]
MCKGKGLVEYAAATREWKRLSVCFLGVLVLFTGVAVARQNEDTIRAPLSPTGRFYLSQYVPHHEDVTWSFGADGYMTFLEGHGLRAWFGVAYRQRAGWDDEATITVFDPRYIDSYQFLSARYQTGKRATFFLHMRRVCFHLIDARTSGSTFWTHAGFGLGTTSPADLYGHSVRIQREGRRNALDGYVFTGPFIHGGPVSILGNNPLWQWETGLYGSWHHRLSSNLLLKVSGTADLLMLTPAAEVRYRWRSALQAGLVVVGRGNGAILAGMEYTLHDDYPERDLPVGQRIVLEYAF